MGGKDHLAWVLRVNALDHTWVTLCKLANVPYAEHCMQESLSLRSMFLNHVE